MKKAIVIGASSGIGLALCKTLSRNGYEVGLVARRLNLLLDLQKDLSNRSYIKQIDVTNTSEARTAMQELIQEMRGVDLMIVNAGVYIHDEAFAWESEKKTIDVNVTGFAAIAHEAMSYFLVKGSGHLVGISSISALRGEASSPSYSASKAFVSNYLEGLRIKAFKENKPIIVTDIQPGWVDTVMAQGQETFWMASAEVAANQIYTAISKKRPHAYITARWRFYAWLVKWAPNWFYQRFLAD